MTKAPIEPGNPKCAETPLASLALAVPKEEGFEAPGCEVNPAGGETLCAADADADTDAEAAAAVPI
ncbi:hypothetical protein GGI12_005665, partial [Dipsacomyces acuminosporus]